MAPDYSTTFGDICKDCGHNKNATNVVVLRTPKTSLKVGLVG